MVAYSPLGHSPKAILGDLELISIAQAAGKSPAQVRMNCWPTVMHASFLKCTVWGSQLLNPASGFEQSQLRSI